jgi:Calx-beta domain
VTVPAGATTATINIPVLDDVIVESGETVIVTLTAVTSGLATLGAPLVATNTFGDNDTATVSIANTTNGAEAGPVNGVMTVTQTAVSATNTVVSYTVTGTAASGADFTPLSGTVTVIAGATTATISIPVLEDLVVEGNETVIVTLTAVTSGLATLGAPVAATNTIADNDTGSITVVNADNAATEAPGNTGTFTVALGLQPSVSVTVTIGGSAQCTYAPTPLTFTAANWNVPQPVTVTPNDDAIVEGPHTCAPASISAAGGAYAGVTATPPVTNITDNDTAAVSIANTTNGAEPATNGLMTVTQTAVSATNTVIAYSLSGTAASGTDYTALSGTVTILAGATTATIPIPILDDAIVEGGETVVVTLTTVTSGLATLGATLIATNTVADNDAATVTIANTTNAAAHANKNVMTMTQTAVSSQATVISYLVSGTAISGSDYTALSGTVTIPAGATTATISIPVLNDLVVEPSETVTVTLSSVTSGLATLGATVIATNTIADNDAATVTITNTTNAAEPATNGLMTLTQTAVSSQATVISYTVGGTATSGSDYTALSGTVTIPAGATTATISIPVLDDLIVDPAETVIVTLSSVTSGLATLGATLIATNIIADNDTASFTINKAVNTANIATPVTLTYTVAIDNTGNVPLTALTITDALFQGAAPRTLTSGPAYSSGDTDADGEIDATETWTYSATYAVTQSNIDTGTTFSNTAIFDTAETASQLSNAATTTITQTPAITLDKTADTAGPLTVGQTINYSYLVTNTGNITVAGVDVNETAFNGNGTPVPAPAPTGSTTLLPGQSVTFIASYIVTQADIDQLQ